MPKTLKQIAKQCDEKGKQAREMLRLQVENDVLQGVLSRMDLEEKVVLEAENLSFDELENFISLPASTDEMMREAIDTMNELDIISLLGEIQEFKFEKEKKREEKAHYIALQIYAIINRLRENPVNMKEEIAAFSKKLAKKIIK